MYPRVFPTRRYFRWPRRRRTCWIDFGKRLDFVEKLEKLYSRLSRRGVSYLPRETICGPTRRSDAEKLYGSQFLEAAALPEQFRWLGRIRRLFAVVYASAAQAIDYGVLPWSKKATLNAILACMTDAMDQLTANFSNPRMAVFSPLKSDDALLAEFKRRVEETKFVRIGPNSRKPHSTQRPIKECGRVCAVHPTRTGPFIVAQQDAGDLVSTCDDAQAPHCSSAFSRSVKARGDERTQGHGKFISLR